MFSVCHFASKPKRDVCDHQVQHSLPFLLAYVHDDAMLLSQSNQIRSIKIQMDPLK